VASNVVNPAVEEKNEFPADCLLVYEYEYYSS
jgi:hypothetical protein